MLKVTTKNINKATSIMIIINTVWNRLCHVVKSYIIFSLPEGIAVLKIKNLSIHVKEYQINHMTFSLTDTWQNLRPERGKIILVISQPFQQGPVAYLEFRSCMVGWVHLKCNLPMLNGESLEFFGCIDVMCTMNMHAPVLLLLSHTCKYKTGACMFIHNMT